MRPDYSNQPASTTLPLLPFMPFMPFMSLTPDMKNCNGLVSGLNPQSNKALLDALDALDDKA